MDAINLAQKLALFSKQWHPHLIAEGASLQVYLSKIQGEFVMHVHDESDELFYVVKGRMEMRFRDRTVEVREGEVILVPQGVEHCPRTEPGQETHVLVVEPRGTTHTGNVQNERTVKVFERI
ncbi:MAG: mannose-6-phosphate isomerase [Candidatus Aminicenantes bacterium RBG_13_63_10]|nr:MAG: mannose-6-phosphate isomerase [Candidatus Aminicenantes bacterium RBG_13_63_10]